MIALWMIYAIGVGLALGTAAMALEQSVRLFRRQARGVWVLALTASLAAPVALAFLPPEIPTRVPVSTVVGPGDVPTLVPSEATIPPAPPPRSWREIVPMDRIGALDRPLIVLWAAASLLTALMLLAAHVSLARDLSRWPRERLHDRAVRVSPDVGPAVVGAWRGEVVLPSWARELPADWQSLIMQHEAEHVAARDALLLLAAAFSVVLCPWNPALWWQRKRLRDAVELDCDARVLRTGANPAAYGALLVDVARRSAGISHAAIALAEPPSLLSRRVAMLISPRVRARAARAVLGVAVGGVIMVLACEAPHPLAPVIPDSLADAISSPVLPALIDTTWITAASRPGGFDTFYPVALRQRAHLIIGFQAVVGADGNVDPASVSIASMHGDSALAGPARALLLQTAYRPGEVNGKASRVRVFQYLMFSPGEPGRTPGVLMLQPLGHRMGYLTPNGAVEYSDAPPQFAEMNGSVEYPRMLLEAGVSGRVELSFEVDADGQVDPSSITVAAATHPALAQAARTWMARARIQPMRGASGPVRSRMHQNFLFVGPRDPPVPHGVAGDDHPVEVRYLPRGVSGTSPHPRVATMWSYGSRRAGSISYDVTMPSGLTGGAVSFGRTTSRAVVQPGSSGATASTGFLPTSRQRDSLFGWGAFAPRMASSSEETFPLTIRGPGIPGLFRLDFVAESSGRVDPATVRFTSPTPPAVQAAVRAALLKADFRSAFVGSSALTRRAHQSINFVRLPSGVAPAQPSGVATSWDPDPPQSAQGAPAPTPSYPSLLIEAGIAGTVKTQFDVDRAGRVNVGSVKVDSSTNAVLTASVRGWLRDATFLATGGVVPATRHLEQTVEFKLVKKNGTVSPDIHVGTIMARRPDGSFDYNTRDATGPAVPTRIRHDSLLDSVRHQP